LTNTDVVYGYAAAGTAQSPFICLAAYVEELLCMGVWVIDNAQCSQIVDHLAICCPEQVVASVVLTGVPA
jgi:hypothetical protein